MDVIVRRGRWGFLRVELLHLRLNHPSLRHAARLIGPPNRADVAPPIDQYLRVRGTPREHSKRLGDILVSLG